MSWGLLMRFIRQFGRKRGSSYLIPLICVVNLALVIFVLSKSNVYVIELEDITKELVPSANIDRSSNVTGSRLCPETVNASFTVLFKPHRLTSVATLNTLPSRFGIEKGGHWRPTVCSPRYKVTLIVCYRDRVSNLRDFLAYMHPFLVAQKLDYRVVIVEQSTHRPFNRAKLFNIGYVEAEKLDSSPCYIFHDVDLIPQNLNNIYACTRLVRHMSANIDIFDYKLPYDTIIGGAVAIQKSQFIRANGFSNTFFGWGGEDDDFYNRITRDGQKICRFSSSVSKYVMLTHDKQKPSADRYYFLNSGRERYNTDGLNSLKYTVATIDLMPLYTRILVDI